MQQVLNVNGKEFIVGEQYWFENHHIASYPCNSNTFIGVLLDIEETRTGKEYIKCSDLLGEEHWLSKYAIYHNDPRKNYKPLPVEF